MPSPVTHCKSYMDIYPLLSQRMKQQYTETWEHYKIFAQGHDFLLFYMFLHLYNFPEIQKKLNLLEENIQELTIRYIRCLQNTNRSAESMLFLYGYLIHHFLDAKLHPLIIYETGDLRSDKNAQALHLLVENMIDAYILKKDGIDPRTYKMHEDLVTSNRALTAETRAIIRVSFHETYRIENIDEIFGQYNKMTRIFLKSMRYDPWGVKKVLLKPLDYLLMGLFKPSILPFHFDGTECLDYLNAEKNLWTHPSDTAVVSTKSFDELYDDGVNEIARMISALDEAIRDRATDAELKSIVPNLSSINGGELGQYSQLSHVKKR